LKSQGITVSVAGLGRQVGQLMQLASAGGGNYADVSQLASLIDRLQSVPLASGDEAANGVEVSHWRDEGIWLLPLLLFLAGMLARRGWL
jgi:Ca-activated chloride channel homolog